MLEPYQVYYYLYYKGDCLDTNFAGICLKENPQDENIDITWDNFTNVYQKYGCYLPFNVWNWKKGREINWFSLLCGKKPPTLKEWKVSNLEIKLVKIYRPYPDISFDELLKLPHEQVIQYLKEKGLTIPF